MIVWVDTETTGLDPETGDLLEVALAVTDDNLVEVAATTTVVQPITASGIKAWRARLNPVIQEMHGKNGLLDQIEAGLGARRHEAEEALMTWVKAVASGRCATCSYLRREHFLEGQINCGPVSPPPEGSFKAVDLKNTQLAGSTVGFDRAWLRKHMPALEVLFHYRSIDVSSLTELAERWAPTVYEGRPKAGAAHRALDDVRESISYLRYYRDCGFIGGAK